MPVSETHALNHDQELAGLDLLELAGGTGESRSRRIWKAAWPKAAAAILGIGIWQLVVWSGWKPEFALAPREAWTTSGATRPTAPWPPPSASPCDAR